MDSITLDNGGGLGEEDVTRGLASPAQQPGGQDRGVAGPPQNRTSLAYETLGVSSRMMTLSPSSAATLTFTQGAASASISQSHSSTSGLVTLSQGSISFPQGTVVLTQGQERMIISQGDSISLSPSFTQDIHMPASEQMILSPDIGRSQLISPGLARESRMSSPMARDQLMSSTMARDQIVSPQSQRDQMISTQVTRNVMLSPPIQRDQLMSPPGPRDQLMSPPAGREPLMSPIMSQDAILSPSAQMSSSLHGDHLVSPGAPTPQPTSQPAQVPEIPEQLPSSPRTNQTIHSHSNCPSQPREQLMSPILSPGPGMSPSVNREQMSPHSPVQLPPPSPLPSQESWDEEKSGMRPF